MDKPERRRRWPVVLELVLREGDVDVHATLEMSVRVPVVEERRAYLFAQDNTGSIRGERKRLLWHIHQLNTQIDEMNTMMQDMRAAEDRKRKEEAVRKAKEDMMRAMQGYASDYDAENDGDEEEGGQEDNMYQGHAQEGDDDDNHDTARQQQEGGGEMGDNDGSHGHAHQHLTDDTDMHTQEGAAQVHTDGGAASNRNNLLHSADNRNSSSGSHNATESNAVHDDASQGGRARTATEHDSSMQSSSSVTGRPDSQGVYHQALNPQSHADTDTRDSSHKYPSSNTKSNANNSTPDPTYTLHPHTEETETYDDDTQQLDLRSELGSRQSHAHADIYSSAQHQQQESWSESELHISKARASMYSSNSSRGSHSTHQEQHSRGSHSTHQEQHSLHSTSTSAHNKQHLAASNKHSPTKTSHTDQHHEYTYEELGSRLQELSDELQDTVDVEEVMHEQLSTRELYEDVCLLLLEYLDTLPTHDKDGKELSLFSFKNMVKMQRKTREQLATHRIRIRLSMQRWESSNDSFCGKRELLCFCGVLRSVVWIKTWMIWYKYVEYKVALKRIAERIGVNSADVLLRASMEALRMYVDFKVRNLFFGVYVCMCICMICL
jgi:hypothetical protein